MGRKEYRVICTHAMIAKRTGERLITCDPPKDSEWEIPWSASVNSHNEAKSMLKEVRRKAFRYRSVKYSIFREYQYDFRIQSREVTEWADE